MKIKTKRVYEDYAAADGFRVLVDHIWPRGVKKEDAHVDLWLKEIAPSGDLRKWFGHDPEKWKEFRQKYFKELDRNPEAIARFRSETKVAGTVTLVYAARDQEHNNAVALKEYLQT